MRHDCEYYLNPESGKCDCCEDIGDAVAPYEAQLATLQKERDEALSKLGCDHLDAPYRRVLQERDEALEKLDAIKKVLESGGKP